MSKAKEAIEPESARKSAEGRVEPNGSIVPIVMPTDNFSSQLEVATDLSMEVDEDRRSADEPEIQWRRRPDDGSSIYQSMPLRLRSLRASDSVSL
jgi:hypothetical protein